MKRNIRNYVQTQVDFVDIDTKFYKNLVYSYNLNYNKEIAYNMKSSSLQKGVYVENEPISTQDRWHKYEDEHGEQSIDDILKLIQLNQKNLSEFRGNPVIAYITAINTSSSKYTSINDSDVTAFVSLIQDIPQEYKEIDVILHSLGGYTESAHNIIELLRDRFDTVNFLIPLTAHSAASMMCMAGDEIIMTPESSLSPFDVQVLAPDNQDMYLPAHVMKKCAKEAKRAHNPLCIFMPSQLYEGWNGKMINRTKLFCETSIKQSKVYPRYWLMKYMFKSYKGKNIFFTKFFVMPFWKTFTRNGRRAKRIINLFVDVGAKLSHSTPIMYNDLKNTGLKVSKADGDLLMLMRETYQLSHILFHKSVIKKLYISADKHFYYYHHYIPNEKSAEETSEATQ